MRAHPRLLLCHARRCNVRHRGKARNPAHVGHGAVDIDVAVEAPTRVPRVFHNPITRMVIVAHEQQRVVRHCRVTGIVCEHLMARIRRVGHERIRRIECNGDRSKGEQCRLETMIGLCDIDVRRWMNRGFGRVSHARLGRSVVRVIVLGFHTMRFCVRQCIVHPASTTAIVELHTIDKVLRRYVHQVTIES